MRARRILTLRPDDDPIWVCLYGQPVGDRWAAMLMADDVTPPESGEMTTVYARMARVSIPVISATQSGGMPAPGSGASRPGSERGDAGHSG